MHSKEGSKQDGKTAWQKQQDNAWHPEQVYHHVDLSKCILLALPAVGCSGWAGSVRLAHSLQYSLVDVQVPRLLQHPKVQLGYCCMPCLCMAVCTTICMAVSTALKGAVSMETDCFSEILVLLL